MKKIVSAVAIAAMAAGLATAEVTISNNFRIRPVVAEWNMGTEAPTLSRYFNLNGVQGASDTFKFTAKTDYAGIITEVNTDAGAEKTNLTISNYNGYLKFGNLTFTGGILDSRIANRVTNDQNNLSLIEQNWGATYNDAKLKSGDIYETNKTNNKFAGNKKLGVNPNTKTITGFAATAGVDSDNITAINGSKVLSFVADYMFADVGGGKLQLWAALNKQTPDSWKTANDDGVVTTEVDSTYAFRAAYTADAFAFDADLHIAERTVVAAAFFSPKMVDGLAATLGFTFANDGKNKQGDDAQKFIAIDARARYAINDATAAGIYLNYTNAMKAGDRDAAGVLDTVANVNFKVNDLVKVFVEGELVFNTNSDLKKLYGHQLAGQLGAIFTAGKGAEIDVAARVTAAGIGQDNEKDLLGTQVSIPVCMRVKL